MIHPGTPVLESVYHHGIHSLRHGPRWYHVLSDSSTHVYSRDAYRHLAATLVVAGVIPYGGHLPYGNRQDGST